MLAIIGYAGCAYHASAIKAAAAAGVEAQVTTVADREAFLKLLASPAMTSAVVLSSHNTSPLVLDTTACGDDGGSLLGATLIGGCDDLKRRLGASTTAEEQRAARQDDRSSRSPAEISSYFHAKQREFRFVIWVLWRGVW
jgi:hypothetical protein